MVPQNTYVHANRPSGMFPTPYNDHVAESWLYSDKSALPSFILHFYAFVLVLCCCFSGNPKGALHLHSPYPIECSVDLAFGSTFMVLTCTSVVCCTT